MVAIYNMILIGPKEEALANLFRAFKTTRKHEIFLVSLLDSSEYASIPYF